MSESKDRGCRMHETVYKLVRHAGDEGAFLSFYPGPQELQYRLGQVTEAKIADSMLFAFVDLESALDWSDCTAKYHDYVVLECRAEWFMCAPKEVPNPDGTDLAKWWSGDRNYQRWHNCWCPPVGCVVTDRLLPVRVAMEL